LPKAGALGTSLLAAVGMTSTSVMVRLIGSHYDWHIAQFQAQGMAQGIAKMAAGSATLQLVALMPLVLVAAYSGLVVWKRHQRTSLLKTAG